MTRVLPPSDGLHNTITVNGRTYTAPANGTVDMPDWDAQVALANGWSNAASGGMAGATATRPRLTKSEKGTRYLDTDLGFVILWDGEKWRNPSSGASV